MKIFCTLLLGVLLSIAGMGQEKNNEKPSKVKISLEGMIGASFGKNFYTVNLGGPTLMLSVGKDWKLGVGAVPSLYAEGGKFGTRLGVTPRVDYKNLVFMTPFFQCSHLGNGLDPLGLAINL
jgi:hypothetical protein